jgi:hypothetical protein
MKAGWPTTKKLGLSFLTFPSKNSSASLALQDLKIEFISPALLVSLGNVEKSIDPEDVSDDLRAESILLNGASKEIKQNYRAVQSENTLFWFFCSYCSASSI